MNYNDPFIMRQVIIFHYQKPEMKGFVNDDDTNKERINSTECIDDITIELIKKNNKVISAKFDGTGCTISTASTDILCKLITNKTIDQANEIVTNFEAMLANKEYDANLLDEALVFQNTYKQKNRVRCAQTGAKAIEKLL